MVTDWNGRVDLLIGAEDGVDPCGEGVATLDMGCARFGGRTLGNRSQAGALFGRIVAAGVLEATSTGWNPTPFIALYGGSALFGKTAELQLNQTGNAYFTLFGSKLVVTDTRIRLVGDRGLSLIFR